MNKVYYLMHSMDNIRGVTDYKDKVVPNSDTIVMDLITGKIVEDPVSIYDCENAVVRGNGSSDTIKYELYEYTDKQYIIDYGDDCMLVLRNKTIIVWYKGRIYMNDFMHNDCRGYMLLGCITAGFVHRFSVVHYDGGVLYGYDDYCIRKRIVFRNKDNEMSKSQFKRTVLLCT